VGFFSNKNICTENESGVLCKGHGRLVGQIGFVARQVGVAATDTDLVAASENYLETIRQGYRHHERFDFVESILPLSEDTEREVDFGWGLNCHAQPNYPRMTVSAKEKIIVAVDAPDASSALRLVEPLAGEGCLFKIGLQLFTAEGPSIVSKLQSTGARIFLDLKFHDIPNTAREAVHSAVRLGVDMTTIDLCGGPEMVAGAVDAAKEIPNSCSRSERADEHG
jgi:hypothetical protein